MVTLSESKANTNGATVTIQMHARASKSNENESRPPGSLQGFALFPSCRWFLGGLLIETRIHPLEKQDDRVIETKQSPRPRLGPTTGGMTPLVEVNHGNAG